MRLLCDEMLRGQADRALLARAAAEGRVLPTRDRHLARTASLSNARLIGELTL